MSTLDRVVIVGASAAGITAADTLRRAGYDGALVLVGDEPHLPYDRPPLSKQVLAGTWEPERTRLRTTPDLDALAAELALGHAATGLDLADRAVLLDDATRIPFDGLVIATGVRPRRLGTGHELEGVQLLRTIDDALELRARLCAHPATVVLGAGFLGAEIAAVARSLGCEVTLVDPLPVPMFRQLGPRIGAMVARLHDDHGVRVRTGVGVERLVGTAGRVTAVALTDGAMVDAELVVVAIGAAPAVDWLEGSGLPLGDGVTCDAYSCAAPGVYAAGDVASWYHPQVGRQMRLEHRMNATEQAMAAARNLLGAGAPFAPVPYFWSDQYDARIQAYGTITADADVRVAYGDLDERRFVVHYVSDGHVIGVLGWNCARELREHRRHVGGRAPLDGQAPPVETATTATDEAAVP